MYRIKRFSDLPKKPENPELSKATKVAAVAGQGLTIGFLGSQIGGKIANHKFKKNMRKVTDRLIKGVRSGKYDADVLKKAAHPKSLLNFSKIGKKAVEKGMIKGGIIGAGLGTGFGLLAVNKNKRNWDNYRKSLEEYNKSIKSDK